MRTNRDGIFRHAGQLDRPAKAPDFLTSALCLTDTDAAGSFLADWRVWFNGRMKASQALDGGSIPLTRFSMASTATRSVWAGFVCFGWTVVALRSLVHVFNLGRQF